MKWKCVGGFAEGTRLIAATKTTARGVVKRLVTVVASVGVRRILQSHNDCDRWANVLSTARKRESCHLQEKACFEIPSEDTGLSHEPYRWSAPDSRIISSSPAITNYTMGVQPAALQVV